MARYPDLAGLMRSVGPDATEYAWRKAIVPYLAEVWLDDYSGRLSVGQWADVVEARDAGFSYLFDTKAERLVAAWGVSRGRYAGERDAGRIAAHPSSAGPLYHRGHAISHRLGGQADINLVPQLARINNGRFRLLENKAVATPGALYFTYWIYSGCAPAPDGRPGQTPAGVDQGLLIPGRPEPMIDHHGN